MDTARTQYNLRKGTPISQRLLRSYEITGLVLLIAVGIALSMGAFYQFRDRGRVEADAEFRREAAQNVAGLLEQVDRHLLLMRTLRGLMTTRSDIGRDEFRQFATEILPSFPAVRAITWLPRVRQRERLELESRARHEGLPNYAIHVPVHLTALPPGDLSYPVWFVEPSAGNEAIYGVDAFSIPDRRRAIEKARDTGEPVVTDPLVLVQSPDGETSAVLYVAAYAGGGVPPTIEARRREIRGVIAVSVRIDRLLSAVFGNARSMVSVYDETVPDAPQLLQHYPYGVAEQLSAIEASAHVKELVQVAGRRWAVYFREPPGRGLTGGDLAAWMALAVGALLTTTLTTYAVGTLFRARRSESLAAAIAEGNANLRREVEERREVERALRKSEDRLRLAIKSAKLSLFSQDLDLRYTWIFKSSLGLTPSETIGRTDGEVMSPEDAARMTALKRRVIETGIGTTAQVPMNFRGRSCYLDVTIEPLFDASGTLTGIIGSAIDVTAERHVQDTLAQARALAERANEAKSRFLAAASHDLRQPLQATRLFLEVLTFKLTDSDHLMIANKALAALEASDGLLNALLDISTLEAGIVKPEIIDFPLQRMVNRLVDETIPQAAAKDLRFNAVSSPAMVRSDPVLLERMIRNLISNALRYTTEGGILLGCRDRRDEVVIEVWDTGAGIPEDKLEAVFEDFFQLDNPARDRSRGLGLGLSVVDRMARLLGHRVSVRSRVGKGSVFRVAVQKTSLPVHDLQTAVNVG